MTLLEVFGVIAGLGAMVGVVAFLRRQSYEAGVMVAKIESMEAEMRRADERQYNRCSHNIDQFDVRQSRVEVRVMELERKVFGNTRSFETDKSVQDTKVNIKGSPQVDDNG